MTRRLAGGLSEGQRGPVPKAMVSTRFPADMLAEKIP
jgi:hypothetical protein